MKCKLRAQVKGGAFVPLFVVTAFAFRTKCRGVVEVDVLVGSEASACAVESAGLGGAALVSEFFAACRRGAPVSGSS